jgi:hypothetical protein
MDAYKVYKDLTDIASDYNAFHDIRNFPIKFLNLEEKVRLGKFEIHEYICNGVWADRTIKSNQVTIHID